MENRYNIQFNRPEPNSQKINDFQDFDQLLQDFAATPDEEQPTAVIIPLWRRAMPYGSAAAAVLAFLVWGLPLLQKNQPPNIDEAAYFAERPFVQPPATANVPDLVAEAVLDPDKDQEIRLDDGELVLSHTALFRNRGSEIRRPVQVHYRQMDEVADYFLAGLPLAFEENNRLIQLDAAVILDVYATAAGEPVPIAANERIAVHLGTQVLDAENANEYRLYRLDTLARSWVDAGSVETAIAATAWPTDWPVVKAYRELEQRYNQRISQSEQNSTSPLPTKPKAPSREIGGNPTLELDFLNGLALAAGSDVTPEDLDRLNKRGIWEMLPETGEIDLRAFNVTWQEVRLRRLGQNDKYELTLLNPQKQEKLIIRPILLDDSNYREAMRRYEAELLAYNAAVEARSSVTNPGTDQLIRERDTALAEAQRAITAYAAQLPDEQQSALRQRRADFRFSISSWGIYAVAKAIQDLPSLTQVTFTGDQSESLEPQTVYVTNPTHKTIYRGLAQASGAQLPLNPSATVWLVDRDGQLSMAQPDATLPTQLDLQAAGQLPNSASLIKMKLGL